MNKRDFRLPSARTLLSLLGIGVLLILLVGCGWTYAPAPPKPKLNTRTTYWYPNWTPDNKLVAMKETVHYRDTAFGEQTESTEHAIVEMDINGDNERCIVSGLPAWIIQVSPSKNYLAFSYSGELWVYDYQGNRVAYTIMGEVYSFDWSPDESRLAVSSQGASGIEVWDRQLRAVVLSVEGSDVSWKYNARMVFRKNNESLPYPFVSFRSIDENIDVTTNIMNCWEPEYLKDSKHVYIKKAGAIRKYDTKSGTYEDMPTDYHNLYRIFFSDDGRYMCGTDQYSGGIFVIDSDGSNVRKIR